MDEQNQNEMQNQAPADITATAPAAVPNATTNVAAPTGEYATFISRFLAVLIDGLIFMVLNLVIMKVFGRFYASFGNLFSFLLISIYSIYFLVNFGATLGKQAMGIRVQDKETGQNISYTTAVLREVVGKLVSSMVLAIGYIWMLFDANKQCWHDKIANTVVIKVKK